MDRWGLFTLGLATAGLMPSVVSLWETDSVDYHFGSTSRDSYALEGLPPETPRRQSMADNQSATRGSDKRKQSLYFPEAMLQEIKDEAARLDRSLSWVVQRAWKMARLEIKKIPSVNEVDEENAGAGLDSKI
jgi:uncharacterized small protein (TIGR04563 family)